MFYVKHFYVFEIMFHRKSAFVVSLCVVLRLKAWGCDWEKFWALALGYVSLECVFEVCVVGNFLKFAPLIMAG